MCIKQRGGNMIKYISNKILNFIYKNCSLPDDMKEVYQYGIEMTISSILNIILIISISLLVKDFISGIVFLLFFIPLRIYCGGYHATSYFRCNTVFVITYVLVFLIGTSLSTVFKNYIQVAEVILLLSFIPVLIFSPVKNKHKKLSDSTAKKCRIISIILYIVLALASIFFCSMELYGSIMVITLASVSVMILVEIFMQRRGYHEV